MNETSPNETIKRKNQKKQQKNSIHNSEKQ